MEYKGILTERKKWFTVSAVIISAIMLVRVLLVRQWAYIPLVLLVMMACFYKKEQIISEDGVDIKGTLFGYVMHNYWKWEDITTLHTDRNKAKPNMMLHIGKDVVARSFVMTHADCQGALKLAAAQNPSIYIENLTEEDLARQNQERQRRQELVRAQKQTKKHKRKK